MENNSRQHAHANGPSTSAIENGTAKSLITNGPLELNGRGVPNTSTPSSSITTGGKRLFKFIRDLFPPLSGQTLLCHYLPMSGALSHSVFTAHLFAPTLLSDICTQTHYQTAINTSLLFQSHMGIGFYVFFRPHLHHLKARSRVEYTVFSSVIFNFGSILLAVLVKAILPKRLNGNTTWKISVGVALSLLLLSRGYNYLNHIDRRTKRLKDFKLVSSTEHGLQQNTTLLPEYCH